MRIFIATPCYGGMVAEGFMTSVVRLYAPFAWSVPDVQFGLQTVAGDADVVSARNRLAASFLRSECDAVLWVDADVVFTQRDLDLLLAADKPFIGGVYPRKRLPVTDFAFASKDGEHGDIVRALGVGFGFTLVRRAVFEAIAPTVDRYGDDDGRPMSDFFAPEIVNGRRFSEDYSFCNRWRRLGGEVWAHLGVQLGHVGNHTFRGDPRGLPQG